MNRKSKTLWAAATLALSLSATSTVATAFQADSPECIAPAGAGGG